MKIIYFCYEASFLPVIAAALNLQLISADKVPSVREFYQLPFYGKLSFQEQGKIILLGKDAQGNEIYILGSRNGINILQRAVHDLLAIFSCDSQELHFFDLRGWRNNLISWGLFFYCTLKMKGLGSFCLTQGIRKDYFPLVDWLKKELGRKE